MTTPTATYRIQLRPSFGFADAAGIVDYLAELGVSHVYCSPELQAAPGSSHGYDVVDHAIVSRDLGGPEAHARFCDTLERSGLGHLLDVVPNHMATSLPHNRWFWDVLQHGPSSAYASHFDVDWDPPESHLRNLVLVPILGDHYGRVLEAGEIRLVHERGRFTFRYHEHELPVAPRSLAEPLRLAARSVGSDDLLFLARSLERLPPGATTDPAGRRERSRDVAVLDRLLTQLIVHEPEVAAAIDAEVARVNADPDALDALLEHQNYRLSYWRAGRHDLGYRRFFDIDTLIALRVEDPLVFDDTHGLVLTWLRSGVLDGLRIDHPDGLRRPGQYFRRLRDAAPSAWIVAEKILEPGEELPPSWPVDGSTGYDFANDVAGVLVDGEGFRRLEESYRAWTGLGTLPYADLVNAAKHQILRDSLAADLGRITNVFVQICQSRRRYRDFVRAELHQTLAETLVALDVYRTYVDEDGNGTDTDRARIDRALDRARAARPDLDPDLFDLLGAVLRGEPDWNGPVEVELRLRFQQLSGAVMAKGVEDTVCYRFTPLAALCEVGGDPAGARLATVAEFHDRNRRAHERQPAGMVTTSTHDTKRSEDVRARLFVLAEVAHEWSAAVERWSVHNARHRAGPERPDRAIEHLVYQTLVGAHPLPIERAEPYVLKAAREAKTSTTWTDPDEAYESALIAFLHGVYADEWFQDELSRVAGELVHPGRTNALAQKLLALTVPGVPDLYQGSELWDLSLVDPDNRRPVDYTLRRRLLAELDRPLPIEEIVARADEGLTKLWVVRQALRVRSAHPAAFGPGADGAYEPLAADGGAAAHVVAFCRGRRVAVVVPRLPVGLRRWGGWADTVVELPVGGWSDVLTGREHDGGPLPMAELVADFPVALLVTEP